ncbi:MAG: DUF5320 domain-containing protein [Oscillospiraceae bacterium]|jgi:hypothetical protein
MPGRDGTGPLGAGPMTGRGLGFCTGGNKVLKCAGLGLGLGLGLACRRGFGRGFRWFSTLDNLSEENRRNILKAQKDALKNRMEAIDQELENL